jgi:hypothetical protein
MNRTNRTNRTPAVGLHTVVLRSFPLALFAEARRHREALLREFAFIVEGGGDRSELPQRLLRIVDRVRARSAGLNETAERAIDEALARGKEAIDVEIVVPLELARGAQEFVALLDEVDEFCRAGDLLTLASSPEVRRFRRWYLGEVTAQVGGRPPTPWTAYTE